MCTLQKKTDSSAEFYIEYVASSAEEDEDDDQSELLLSDDDEDDGCDTQEEDGDGEGEDTQAVVESHCAHVQASQQDEPTQEQEEEVEEEEVEEECGSDELCDYEDNLQSSIDEN